jgi:hypothetical protein
VHLRHFLGFDEGSQWLVPGNFTRRKTPDGLDPVGVKTSASRLGYTPSAQDWSAFEAVDLGQERTT